MLVPDAEVAGGERAKVLDFGLAKLHWSQHGIKTRTGTFFGTPVYMSPEQCGRKAPISDKSDVYALGVTLFEMLVGQPPFLGEEPNQLLGQHLFTVPPEISDFVSTAPPAVVTLVKRMLAKDPAERPSMSAVAAELDVFSALQERPLPISTPGEGRPKLALAQTLASVTPELPRGRRMNPGALPPSPGRNSTLGRALGQLRNIKRAGAAVALGVLLMCIAAVIGARVALLNRPADSVAAPLPAGPQKPKVVRWSIQSRPPGAQVYRISDGQVLGQTPWLSEQDAAPGEVLVSLRLPDYKEAVLTLERSSSLVRIETLVPIEPTEKPVRPAVPPPVKRSKRKTAAPEEVELVPVR